MKRTISVNISNTPFFIDNDAYDRLNQYLSQLTKWFSNKEGGSEIIEDVENRLSELFSMRIDAKLRVVTIDIVNEVIEIMGQPEDFVFDHENNSSFNEQTNNPEADNNEYHSRKKRRLYRNIDNDMIGGVCSGLAAYFNIDPVIVRVIFVILPFLSFGLIIPIYIILWIIMPAAVTTTQKMEMRGEPVTISNIEKNIRAQYQKAKKGFDNFSKR
ncbi:PspC domain-containing protein [Marinilabiliaceae bacterium ANBcel2]|nr:PspC domain-containing protein [Marinilabiliaceae bacterium ANBcel2]